MDAEQSAKWSDPGGNWLGRSRKLGTRLSAEALAG
jgi:hypothetical protein